MSKFKGSKGKWIFKKHDIHKSLAVISVYNESGDVICRMMRDDNDNNEIESANALLISKAPEMLDMLKKCRKTLKEKYHLTVTELDDLIKEATEL